MSVDRSPPSGAISDRRLDHSQDPETSRGVESSLAEPIVYRVNSSAIESTTPPNYQFRTPTLKLPTLDPQPLNLNT
jgi:hypothetical protein